MLLMFKNIFLANMVIGGKHQKKLLLIHTDSAMTSLLLHFFVWKKNGRSNAKLLFVWWGNWARESNSGHFVCILQDNEKYYSIDNGHLKGPFVTFDQLLKSASRKRKIKGYKFFGYEDIPFHTSYYDMISFASSE